MHEHGIHIAGRIDYHCINKHGIANPIVQRFKDSTRPGTKGKNLFVILWDNEDATFGDWRNEQGWVYWRLNASSSRAPLSYSEQRKRQEAAWALQQHQQFKKARCIARAWRKWNKAEVWCWSTKEHPYVVKKRIRAYYARVIVRQRWIKDVLLVPIRDINYQFQGLQVIKANGFKRFWKGMTFKGNMIWLSEKLNADYRGNIYICEGYATGCSIYEAVGSPVVCALNNYNLIIVCELLKTKFRFAKLIVCADNDVWTEGNPGITCGLTAMKKTGAIGRYPVFDNYDQSGKPTDFNDLFCLAGVEAVENQIITQY